MFVAFNKACVAEAEHIVSVCNVLGYSSLAAGNVMVMSYTTARRRHLLVNSGRLPRA